MAVEARHRGDYERADQLARAAIVADQAERIRENFRDACRARGVDPADVLAAPEPIVGIFPVEVLADVLPERECPDFTLGAAPTENPDRAAPRRRCGVPRFGRRVGHTFVFQPPCRSRSCPLCGPMIAAEKVKAIPDVLLYAKEIERSEWGALRKKLGRRRDRDEAADYSCIPRSEGRLLVVSDAEIGPSIEREQVEVFIREADPADGNVSASPSWRAQRPEAPEGFVDEGRVYAEMHVIVERAVQLGLDPKVAATTGSVDFGRTSSEEHAALRVAADVRDDIAWLAAHRRRRASGRQLVEALRARRAA